MRSPLPPCFPTPDDKGQGRSIRVTDCSLVAEIHGANAVAPTKLLSPAPLPPCPPAPCRGDRIGHDHVCIPTQIYLGQCFALFRVTGC
ncbi:hypothetical protein H6G82_21415 [Planktothricoides sp. FACHB-1261]|nr:hypothetical protein [Planktothricoides raciborskii FACHB-1261]